MNQTRSRMAVMGTVVASLLIALGVFIWTEREGESLNPVIEVAGGDPLIGRDLISDYGCIACHTVPGVRGPNVYVGPPLDHWAERRYITGRVENTPENLVRWIQIPQSIDPETAMPTLGVGDEDARHIASYLYTLDE